MNLYTIHQPDTLGADFGSECWGLVWADTCREALAVYVAHYKGECDPRATDAEFAAGCAVEPQEDHGQTPAESGAHFERRCAVQRQLGFHCDGETQCESCGLFAMDMEEFAVCVQCNQCEECGHADDCDELVDTVLVVEKGQP